MPRKFRIYLSGPIEFAPDAGVGWREQIIAGCSDLEDNVQIFNPCDTSLPVLERHGLKSIPEYNKLKTFPVGSPEFNKYIAVTNDFFALDISELGETDLVVARLDSYLSGGTAGELTYSAVEGIPVLAFLEEEHVPKISGWVLSCCTQILSNKTMEESIAETVKEIHVLVEESVKFEQEMMENIARLTDGGKISITDLINESLQLPNNFGGSDFEI